MARYSTSSQVVFHAMHPAWVDTPGVETSVPTFHRLMKPLQRSPEQGADTVAWLATDPQPLASTGEFWHDRRLRSEHRLPWTHGNNGGGLTDLCVTRTGRDLL